MRSGRGPSTKFDLKLHLSGHPCCTFGKGERLTLLPHDGAMLAFLALEGPTARARMAALLWPDRTENMARNLLRQRLYQLRQRVGVDLVVGAETLSLADGVVHDLDDADSVLGDAAYTYGAEFIAWLEQQRMRRRERLRQSLVDLCEMAEHASDWADALVHAGELLAMDPLSEIAHQRLIRLHYLAGDRAAALLAFDRCEQVLKDDVGVAPSPQTLELLQTIERAGPPMSPGGGALASPVTPKVPLSVSRPPRCIGREAAFAVLCKAGDAGQVVLLVGEAGMGKTRLLSDLEASESGRRSGVLLVAARPGDAMVPYASLGRFIRSILGKTGSDIEPATRRVLARVLPEFGDAVTMTGDESRARLVHALDVVLRSAAGCGLRTLVVDDLQFADDASVELLAPLIASGHNGWILAVRPGELSAAGRALIDGLGGATQLQTLSLQPLDCGEIAALLESLAIPGIGGQAQAEALLQRTGGNPMFLLETLKAALMTQQGQRQTWVWPSAPNVTRLIQQRLARLSPQALRAARCAAVAGQDLSVPLVAQVLGLRPLDLSDAWAELEAAQMLRDGRFVHDLIAEAALAAVPAAVARTLHGEVADFLERESGEPARIASHWLAAGRPLQAVPLLKAAAGKAGAALRWREAAELYQSAAVILREAGQRRAAFDAFFAQADALSEAAIDQRLIDCAKALRELADDGGQRSMTMMVDAALLVENRRLDEAQQLAKEAVPLAQAAGLPEIESELVWILAVMHWERRELAEAVRLTERGIALLPSIDAATSRLGSATRELRMMHGLGVFLAAAGRYEQSNAQLAMVYGQARKIDDWSQALAAANALAANALDQGDLAQALDWSAEVERGLDRMEAPSSSRAIKIATRATALATAGELGAALALFDCVAQWCDEGMVRMRVRLMLQRELLYADLGRRDLAARGLRSLQTLAVLSGLDRTLIDAALLSIGEAADAAAVLDQLGHIDDVALRWRVLCMVQPGCDPAQVLPLLDASLAAAHENGAHGLWLDLQSRRVAALRGAGRADEAAKAARAAWQRIEDGVCGSELFPRIAAELCAALSATRADLAQLIAARASGWMHRAASTLPPEWREAYLARGVQLPRGPNAGLPASR